MTATHRDANPWHVEVVADSDSRWKWGAAVAERLAGDHGARIHASLLLGRSVPNDRQMSDVGVEPASLRRASIADTVARLADTDADVVVLACIGGCVQALMQALSRAWTGRTRRPVVVTGYVGLVFEKITDGLVNRAGADVVLANCPDDAARFARTLAGLGADPESVIATALPFLGGEPYRHDLDARAHPFTLTFVAQPGVPETREHRRHVLDEAARYARSNPDHEVIMKLRGRPGERTTHVEPHHYATLLPAEELPSNLSFAYGAMTPVLDRTDVCVTVSSTAGIEAMHRGIPTAVLTDYGVREALGNQLFIGSGAMTSWAALHRHEWPSLDAAWADGNGVTSTGDPYAPAAAHVAELVDGRNSLPPLRPWLDEEKAGAYLPELLARYSLDPDGAVRIPDAHVASARPPLAKRALRRAARRAYGYGVRVLEPRIKRMAQL